jgi:putative transposase
MNFNNNKKTRKYKESVNKRIKGLIDELHWKSIKFLTDNYKTILIGDLSTKGIVCSSTSVLKKYNKELAYALSFYKYRERLKYKCLINNSNYLMVNERYTSKVCSVCGEFKDDLDSSKIYKCKKCMSIIDRDVNGCRNIILKCL